MEMKVEEGNAVHILSPNPKNLINPNKSRFTQLIHF
jgi:hypothetical protein